MIPGYESHRRARVEVARAHDAEESFWANVDTWGEWADTFPAIESRDAMGRAALFTLVWLLTGDDE